MPALAIPRISNALRTLSVQGQYLLIESEYEALVEAILGATGRRAILRAAWQSEDTVNAAVGVIGVWVGPVSNEELPSLRKTVLNRTIGEVNYVAKARLQLTLLDHAVTDFSRLHVAAEKLAKVRDALQLLQPLPVFVEAKFRVPVADATPAIALPLRAERIPPGFTIIDGITLTKLPDDDVSQRILYDVTMRRIREEYQTEIAFRHRIPDVSSVFVAAYERATFINRLAFNQTQEESAGRAVEVQNEQR